MPIKFDTDHNLEDGSLLIIHWLVSPGRPATREDPPEYTEAEFEGATLYTETGRALPIPADVAEKRVPLLTEKSWRALTLGACESYEERRHQGDIR